jgi:hypothetical protein
MVGIGHLAARDGHFMQNGGIGTVGTCLHSVGDLVLSAHPCQSEAMRRRRPKKKTNPGAILAQTATTMGIRLGALGRMLGYSPRQTSRLMRHSTGHATPRLRRALEAFATRDFESAKRIAEAFGVALEVAPAVEAAKAAASAAAQARASAATPIVAVAIAARDALRALGDALVLLAERDEPRTSGAPPAARRRPAEPAGG